MGSYATTLNLFDNITHLCGKIKKGDSMKIFVLASGSKGNAMCVEFENETILIDVGISYMKIKEKVETLKIDLDKIKVLFLTHEHHDHIMGLMTFLKKSKIETVYLSKGTLESLPEKVKIEILKKEIVVIKADEVFHFDNTKITTVGLSHDANEPLGFVFEKEDKKFVHLTDTGYVDHAYYELLENANIYFLEANHEPEMLLRSARPFALKKRILSELGHLSNDDASWLINRVIKQKAIWVIAHISEDCNTQIAIEESIIKHVEDPTLLEVYYADQTNLLVFEI